MKGSEFKLECDMAVVAIGAGANPLLPTQTPGLELNKRGAEPLSLRLHLSLTNFKERGAGGDGLSHEIKAGH
jgi:NADPH-dependent glutamate synthase beta subunit-like oxidoreductase